MLLLGLSYYARARIGVQRWRVLHRFTALAWLLGLVHALGEGTDAGQTWFLAMTAIVVAPRDRPADAAPAEPAPPRSREHGLSAGVVIAAAGSRPALRRDAAQERL